MLLSRFPFKKLGTCLYNFITCKALMSTFKLNGEAYKRLIFGKRKLTK
uniref:Uncharacterized protein n=1 Tax=Meloidogyne enterolobii TaxID=390850 RepID=A0A6V7V1F9_MELEN|nr:unnamed protein product [Meloidogyne enterolobii]